jgi:hypothetical protein
MNPDSIETRACELAIQLPLTKEDWDAIVLQARDTIRVVRGLDDLPLDGIEPAATYRIDDARSPSP